MGSLLKVNKSKNEKKITARAHTANNRFYSTFWAYQNPMNYREKLPSSFAQGRHDQIEYSLSSKRKTFFDNIKLIKRLRAYNSKNIMEEKKLKDDLFFQSQRV